MIIKQVTLRNIRSYIDETITFPEGSTLLAGEIGSGKTSILLAIEFALFGITRGVLSGSSLLRLGEEDGSVELSFSIEDKDCTIKRALKRSKDDVRQDTGFIIIDGQKQECTPVELKSIVLELLGYPRQLLTKSKSLIYRYTVYTPQEQMKQILLEEGETRLDTLRKLFQIDKYQRIRENTIFLLRDLKQRQALLKGQLQDLDDKERQLSTLDKEISLMEKELARLSPLLSRASSQLKDKQLLIKAKEAQLKELSNLKSSLATASAQANEKFAQLQLHVSELETLKKSIALSEEKLSALSEGQEQAEKLEDESELDTKLDGCEARKVRLINERTALESEIAVQKARLKEQDALLTDLSSLKKCPTCLQEIDPSHIFHIKEEQNSKAESSKKIIAGAMPKLEEVAKELLIQEQSASAIRQSLKRLNQQKLALKERQNLLSLIKEKQERIALLEQRQKELKKEIGALSAQKLQLEEQIGAFKDLEKEQDSLRFELEGLERAEKSLLVENSRAKATYDSLSASRKNLLDEIVQKKQAKEELTTLTQKQNWLTLSFTNLMTSMEQHVMMRVYNEFNDIFQEYFSMLLEDAILSVNLDEAFTPLIEQNGYEIYYEDLSGGEKTSIALAYRLSLNRVINDLIDTIKTKDIIILDEPTDGFSTEQLDKMRVVLENLDTKQAIIVSHEQKIESFVDSVIRIGKREHTSHISI